MPDPIKSPKLTDDTRPKLFAFGIRYAAFQADPEEPLQHLNPFWPIDKGGKRFLECEYSSPYQNEAVSHLSQDKEQKQTFLVDAEINAETLFSLADQDDEAAATLQKLAFSSVRRLVSLAAKGNAKVIRTLWDIAHLSTSAIGALGTKHSDIRKIAEEELEWPVLQSTISGFSPKLNLADLPLATNIFPKLSKGSRFKISTPVGRIAFRLYEYVRNTRLRAIAVAKKRGLKLENLRSENQAQLTIEESAALLPEFSRDSEVIALWWKTAKRCLLEAYPHPNSPEDLDERVPVLSALVTARTHRKAGPGTVRHKILEKLEDSFYSFSGFLAQDEIPKKIPPSKK